MTGEGSGPGAGVASARFTRDRPISRTANLKEPPPPTMPFGFWTFGPGATFS
jgi:hypothetical protein